MTIKLGSALEKHLVIEIANGLHDTKPKYGFVFVEDFRWADELLAEFPPDAVAKIERFIGENGLSEFIAGEVDRDYDKMPDRPKLDSSKPITQLPFINNTLQFARIIVERLKLVPYRYNLHVALPGSFSSPIINEVDESYKLSADVSICNGQNLIGKFATKSNHISVDAALYRDWENGKQVTREWKTNRLYFSLNLVGYDKASPSSALSRQVEDHLRAFYGASASLGMLGYAFDRNEDDPEFVTIHDGNNGELNKTVKIEAELRKNAEQCSTKNFAKNHNTELKETFSARMSLIKTIFQKDIDCSKLFSACIWFYRARANNRPLDALLQATIAIETMLGDQKAAEGVGLTNLLASRCAYLLGNSSVHRTKIADDFKKIYALRSSIVHEGRHIHRVGDRETLKLATDLCRSIIARELYIRRNQET